MRYFPYNRRTDRLAHALACSERPQDDLRPADAYPEDSVWAASAFLLALLSHAERLRMPLSRERAQAILADAGSPVTIERLHELGFVQFVLGRLQVAGVISEELRRKQRRDALPEAERSALERLQEASDDRTAPLWVPKAEMERLHGAHAAAHPRTPTLAALVELGVLSPATREGVEGYALPLNESLWASYLGSRVLGLYWEELIRDKPRVSDDKAFSRWLDVALEVYWWVRVPEQVAKAARERLLDAALRRVLAEVAIWAETKSLVMARDGETISFQMADSSPPSRPEDSIFVLHDRWTKREEHWNWCPDELRGLLSLVVCDEQEPWSGRVIELACAARKYPFLMYWIHCRLLWTGRRAIANLVGHLETASVGMQILARLEVAERWEGENFNAREREKDELKTDIWRGAVEVLLATIYEEMTAHPAEAARALAEALLVAVQATIRQSGNSALHDIQRRGSEDRLAVLLDRLKRSREFVLLPLVKDLHGVLAERIERSPEREAFDAMPVAEMRVLFWLLRAIVSAGDATSLDPMQIAEALLSLYRNELGRSVQSDRSSVVWWTDDAPDTAMLPWMDLVLFLQQQGAARRLIAPEGIDFHAQLQTVPAFADIIDSKNKGRSIHDLYQAWIRKTRLHVRILMRIHEGLVEPVLDPLLHLMESQKNALLGLLEDRLREIVIACAPGDRTSQRPSLFEPDTSHSIPGVRRASGVLVPLIRAFNRFSGERRERAFTDWISVERNPIVLLTIIDEAIPSHAKGEATKKLAEINLDEFVAAQFFITSIEQVAEAAAVAGKSEITRKILAYGDSVVGAGYRSKWELFAYRIRLLNAYHEGDIDQLDAIPQPVDAEKQRIRVDGYMRDPVEDTRSFYRALLLLKEKPEVARRLFDDLFRRHPGSASHALNRFAASLRAARKLEDTDKRRHAFLVALQEWEEAEPSIPTEALANIKDSVAYSRLASFDGAELPERFDAGWARLETTQRVLLDFVALAVENARRRGLAERINKILDEARPYYVDHDGTVDERFAKIATDAKAGGPVAIAPAPVDDKLEDDVDALRRSYLELQSARADVAARVVGRGDLEVHAYLAEILYEAAVEFLERRAHFADVQDEDRYNDMLVSFMKMSLKFLGWQVPDQSRGGFSETKNGVGERDWKVNDGRSGPLAIFEALCLSSVKTSKISAHVEKAVSNYNTTGISQVYIVVYYHGSSWSEFWEKYMLHVRSNTPADLVPVPERDRPWPDRISNLRVTMLAYVRDRVPLYVYHLAINMNGA